MAADANDVGDRLLRETTTNPERSPFRRRWQILTNAQLSTDFVRD